MYFEPDCNFNESDYNQYDYENQFDYPFDIEQQQEQQQEQQLLPLPEINTEPIKNEQSQLINPNEFIITINTQYILTSTLEAAYPNKNDRIQFETSLKQNGWKKQRINIRIDGLRDKTAYIKISRV